jgi:hypothetical protein
MDNYLKMAPYREGGAGKGCSVPGGAFGVRDRELEPANVENDVESDTSS